MNAAIIRLAMRSLFGRPRAFVLLAMPAIMVGLAAVITMASSNPPDSSDAEAFLRVFGIGIVVPVVTLIATTTLVNSEFDDGSIVYLLTKPISRLSIMASKAVVVLLSVLVCGVLPVGIAGFAMVGGDDRVALAGVAGSAVAGVAYVGIFTALVTVLNRSIVGCLIYWLVWESTISSLIGPVKWLSARAWGSSVVQATTELGDRPAVPVAYAVVAAVVILLGGVALAAQRLVSVSLSDD
ncbi:ABC transporter permease [Luteipulveratus mongoliensis]|uniref:ABC transporter permease n=1 Tax=Luteipulveratus mongoliensis TaxID=571913 RepID=A0A0K1JMH6_9MICO|nr:ABC transporter permease [Luteipulveratus mongoliensis]AKU17783.1 hypothetical protein VV02_21215 [Luteipulveratus mongoliensis]